MSQERVVYLKRKPYYPLFERSVEIGGIFAMEDSRVILVKVVLFQSRGRGHPQGNATPNFFPDSKSSISVLLNDVSFFSGFIMVDQLKKQNGRLKT